MVTEPFFFLTTVPRLSGILQAQLPPGELTIMQQLQTGGHPHTYTVSPILYDFIGGETSVVEVRSHPNIKSREMVMTRRLFIPARLQSQIRFFNQLQLSRKDQTGGARLWQETTTVEEIGPGGMLGCR